MTTIIAAIDLSDLSRGVATLAAGIARAFGDQLLIVHAVDARFTSNTDGGPPPGQDELALIAGAAEEALRELRGSLGVAGLAIETRVLVGPPDAAIESLVRDVGARMIVAGTHGRGVVGRMLSGSVVERLVLRVPCPVLVVRHGHPPTSLERWLERPGGQPLGPLGQAQPEPAPLRMVVGVDRDQATDAALAFAQELSARGPCELTLVHEYWPPGEYVRLGMRGPRDLFETDPEVAAVLERDLRLRISRKWSGMLSSPSVRFRVCAEWGPIGDALAREAHEAKADLIIVGSSQPHGWRRLKRASVALSTLHFAPIPLLCVPERPPATTQDHDPGAGATLAPLAIAAPLRSVLAATDLSEAGAAAVSHALSLLRAQGGVAHICTVSERALPSPMYVYAAEDGALSPAQIAALEDRLRLLVPAEAKGLGIDCRPCVIDGGDAAEQLVAASLRLGVDAIVVASHGRSGVKRAVLGSVAEGVLRRAEVPVYVVHRGPAERD